jgi:hypothetical protein
MKNLPAILDRKDHENRSGDALAVEEAISNLRWLKYYFVMCRPTKIRKRKQIRKSWHHLITLQISETCGMSCRPMLACSRQSLGEPKKQRLGMD